VLFSLFLAACSSTPTPTAETSKPEWFGFELTDVQTGETFTMDDFAGKVVLVETMAMWCPNCVVQANEVRNLHNLLGNPDGLEWHFAVAQPEVARALGNLYSAQYLNPPLSPALIIDRE